jgi:hypothetical protein
LAASEASPIRITPVDGPIRAFVCTAPNAWGYPAKDRAGRLEQIEEPHLGKLITKLVGPGQRKPSLISQTTTGDAHDPRLQ